MNDIARESVLGSAPAPAAPQPLRLRFIGSGSEYFRIWIVNLLLTIVTLGIYSAWAKVRTLQYFYRNTQLAGSSFDYHGSPIAILKGRAIIFVLAFAFNLLGHSSPLLGLALLIVMAAAFPWLLVRSLRFRMANSSYRGLRFAFTGKDAEGYMVFLVWPILSVLSLYLLAPLAHQRFKRFQHKNTRFGTAQFDFPARRATSMACICAPSGWRYWRSWWPLASRCYWVCRCTARREWGRSSASSSSACSCMPRCCS